MIISPVFNRRFHGMLKEFQMKKGELIFRDERYPGGALMLRPRMLSYQSFKELMKQLNLDFPKDELGIGVSTTVLENRDMVQHLEWLRMVAGDNGFSFVEDEEEWKRLLEQAGIYR